MSDWVKVEWLDTGLVRVMTVLEYLLADLRHVRATKATSITRIEAIAIKSQTEGRAGVA